MNSEPTKTKLSSDEKKPAPQDDGMVIGKSLLTIGISIAGFLLPAAADMGAFGAAICLLAAVFLGAWIWRK